MNFLENILFAYNIVLTVFLTIALTGFYIVYMKSRKKGFLFLSLLYFFLIIDNSIIYISEFSRSFESLYETSDILYIVIDLVYLGIILATRLIISELFSDKFTAKEKQLCITVPIILILISFIAPFRVSEISIFIAFFIALSYLVLKIYKNIKSDPDTFNETKSKRSKVLMFIIITLCILGSIESGFYFMSYLSDSYIDSAAVSLEYRNIAFDIIKLLILVIGIKNLYSSFENLFDEKNVHEKGTDEKLIDFCIKYSLTSRQKEIIQLIIEGYTNKEISMSLHITEGTVKTHIYNIFKKTDISSRNQMLKRIMHN